MSNMRVGMRLGIWEKKCRAMWHKTKPVISTFCLPLLLCILGMAYHFRKDYKHFFFVLALFLLMGVGLVLYLNMPPSEPRERDYIYLGSYYAFAIWGGMGLAYVDFFLQTMAVYATFFGDGRNHGRRRDCMDGSGKLG